MYETPFNSGGMHLCASHEAKGKHQGGNQNGKSKIRRIMGQRGRGWRVGRPSSKQNPDFNGYVWIYRPLSVSPAVLLGICWLYAFIQHPGHRMVNFNHIYLQPRQYQSTQFRTLLLVFSVSDHMLYRHLLLRTDTAIHLFFKKSGRDF